MSEPVVFELTGGRVVLDGTVVLDDVDFSLSAGEFVVLLGPNGSGKTTLVRALLGLVPLAAGRLRLFGRALPQFREWRRIGYVPQRFTAASGVPATVEEVVLSGRLARSRVLRRFGSEDRRAVQHALERADLAELAAERVATLSGGQQQRVLIARALATEPDVLVLDEPASAVDLEHQETFAATLRGLSAEGRSVLLVAHALGAMAPLVRRAVALERGHVVYEGSPRAHDEHPGHRHHSGDELRDAALDTKIVRAR